MKKALQNKLNTVIGNKYLLTVFLFLLWISFFDQDNWVERGRNQRELDGLYQEIEEYKQKIEEDKRLLQQIQDPDFLEKFAREEYFMKKENEDIFIVIED